MMNPKVKDLCDGLRADIPERPPDLLVPGNYSALMTEIRADAEDYSCEDYSVFHDGTVWNVWRNK